MFERRLKIVLVILVLCSAGIIWRLYDLQVLQGDAFAEKLDAALIAPKRLLPPLRGEIRDRVGRVLAADQPAYDVTVHYGALTLDEGYLARVAAHLRRTDPALAGASGAELIQAARRKIAAMWKLLEESSGVPLSELRRRRDAICRSIDGLRRHIWRLRREQGFDEPLDKLRLREEDQFHPIIQDVSPEVRTRIELALSDLPPARVEPSVRRVVLPEAQPLCHVIGRLGQVTSGMIARDALVDDPLARYRPGDLVGVSGIERLGEAMLRGKRGFDERYLDGAARSAAPPIDGLDVQLTIDLDLQRRVVEILTDAVAAQPPSTGGSCVVIDVESREILALASVPTFDPARFRADYALLRDETRTVPLRFRAVAEEYQPGSILKPVALLAGLAHRVTTPSQTFFCSGSLIPESSKWHCWTHWRGMAGHGEIAAEEAIQHSCNVYFYTLGQRLGAPRLTDFYRRFTSQATGLIEERGGLIPDREWMRKRARREFTRADGRNYAIGQGEVQITPLQAANIFATLAAGHHRDPTIIANDHRDRPRRAIEGIREEDWALARRGLYRCVNEEGGTAYKYARMEELTVCGKTGSAQCVPRVTKRRYAFEAADGATQAVIAPTVEAAREALSLPPDARPVKKEIVETWPPKRPDKGEAPTHAWFAGFAPYRRPKVAIAIIIEYGGGGGTTAGPAARAVFEALLASPADYLGMQGSVTAMSGGE